MLPRSKTSLLLEEIAFLRAQVAQLQNYVLLEHTPQAIPAQVTETEVAARQRLFSTEWEEDIEFATKEGLLNKEQAEEMLRRAGGIESEIDFE